MGKLKVLDLFSGIGSFSYGLESAGGFDTVAFCEIDKDCRKVLDKWWPDTPKFSDIKNIGHVHIFHGEDYLYEVYSDTGETILDVHCFDIDVVCGGFPCTDLSVAGKKKGFIDEQGKVTRSGLWFEYKEIIKKVKPRWVIIENVPNLLNLGFATVLQDLHSLGYNAEWEIISARSLGAPHLRERIWIVAYLNSQQLRDQSDGEPRSDGPAITPNNGTKRDTNSPDPDDFRFWPTFTSEEEKQIWWTEATSKLRDRWEVVPDVCGIYDGPSGKLYESHRRARIKQLGNTLIPQIAQLIGERILFHEGK